MMSYLGVCAFVNHYGLPFSRGKYLPCNRSYGGHDARCIVTDIPGPAKHRICLAGIQLSVSVTSDADGLLITIVCVTRAVANFRRFRRPTGTTYAELCAEAAWACTIPMPGGRRACLKAGRLVEATAAADMTCFERITRAPGATCADRPRE